MSLYNIILVILIFIIICSFFNNNESFEVLLSDKRYDNDVHFRKVNLNEFFKFLEYYMTNDMDPRNKPYEGTCYIKGEEISISNNIRNLLTMLNFIVNTNDKDNFYHRYLITKIGSNLQYHMREPKRRLNFDEMVRNNIGKQFTFLKKSAIDYYYPKPSLNSKHQEPIPFSISVHNYYTYETFEINLLALQNMIKDIQRGDRLLFIDIIRPTEHRAFEKEFLIPMKSVINSMLKIIKTSIYRNYINSMLSSYNKRY
jgi:hypothetical protein